ncbi:MAG: hypothetical protein R3E50_03255 [Halioglobus sp.]
MIKSTTISEEDQLLMAQYHIRAETRTIFYSEGYKYDKLQDALNYARLVEERALAPAE